MLLFPDINVKISGRSLSSRPAAFLFPRPASHWGLAPAASPHRLSLGSGTDVKSLATFSSGPDPSERPRRKCSK